MARSRLPHRCRPSSRPPSARPVRVALLVQGAVCGARSQSESSPLHASLCEALHHGQRSVARGVAEITVCPSCSVSAIRGLQRACLQRLMLAKQVEG
eukprot:9470656-Alexandrium_andersonii.AAC.2